MIKIIPAILLAFFCCQLQAQNQEFKRVLVLHGVWKADVWEGNFDDRLEQKFEEEGPEQIEVSFRYLGLDSELNENTYNGLKQNVQDTINEQSVDLVIGAVQAASRFLLELEGIDHIPKILVVPGEELAEQVKDIQNIGVIPSASDEAIEKTIEQILILRPNTKTIEVVSGNSDNDLAYMEKTKRIAKKFENRVNFNFQSGRPPEEIFAWVTTLDTSSVIFNLPFESYGEVITPVKTNIVRTMANQGKVPIFSFYDTLLGMGIAGGHVTSTEGYVNSTVELTRAMLRGLPPSVVEPRSSATTQYDWNQVQKWNLPLNRLNQPYQVLFQPPTLWETNRVLVITVANIFLLLAALIVFLIILLQRSRHAQSIVAASEQQARLSERKYRLLALNSVDVIWTWNNTEKTIDYCSPSIKALSGFLPEQYQQKTLADIMTPESVEAFTAVVNRSPPTADVLEVQYYRNNRETVWCEVALQPMQQESDGKHWVAATRDISQRKRADEERLRLEEKILQNQKFESLGTLAGGIAHDFNNILGIFVGVADMLEPKLKNNPSGLDLLKRLRSANDRAKGLVNQILTFSRHSKGERTATNLAKLLQETLELIRVGIPPTVKVIERLDEQEIIIHADTTQLEQVILNLVTNAYEAFAGSSGQIEVSLFTHEFNQEYHCTFGAAKASRYAVLDVKDNGPGLRPEDMERIFDPFYTSKALGNGMGLSIVHGIVIGHGGCIDIQSTIGKGTQFTIYLPVSELKVINKKNIASTTSFIRPLNVLAIDDQPELLEVLKIMLTEMGHDCIACEDPKQGLKVIDKSNKDLDVIISDFSMPNVSGLDIIDYCDKNYPDIPVILCSGYGDQIPKGTLEAYGNSYFINKPFSMVQIKEVLTRVITLAPTN